VGINLRIISCSSIWPLQDWVSLLCSLEAELRAQTSTLPPLCRALFGLGVVGEWKVEGVSEWKCEESVEKVKGVWIEECV